MAYITPEQLQPQYDVIVVGSGAAGGQTAYTLAMALLADDLRRAAARHEFDGAPLRLQVGLHRGPAAGAVVGAHRAFYCLYGDTVNTAARMCKCAGAGPPCCSAAF